MFVLPNHITVHMHVLPNHITVHCDKCNCSNSRLGIRRKQNMASSVEQRMKIQYVSSTTTIENTPEIHRFVFDYVTKNLPEFKTMKSFSPNMDTANAWACQANNHQIRLNKNYLALISFNSPTHPAYAQLLDALAKEPS